MRERESERVRERVIETDWCPRHSERQHQSKVLSYSGSLDSRRDDVM